MVNMSNHLHPLNDFAPPKLRWKVMAHVGLSMLFHNKLKLLGTLCGVVFAVILANQQAGTFLGMLSRNTMLINNAGADIWVTPRSTEVIQAGKPLAVSDLMAVRTTPGIAWAEPLIVGGGTIALPWGGVETITIMGVKYPNWRGGPWNLVRGSVDVLRNPDTLIFEDSEREKLGNLNIGSIREVNGRKVYVGGFTWGLLPFGPSYAFAEYDLARMLTNMPNDETSFVMAGVAPGYSRENVAEALRKKLLDARIFTSPQFEKNVNAYVLKRTPMGVTFGSSTIFGLLIGFVIVSLSMFSSVVDNIREFGTLKAIGATTADLAKLLLVQSVAIALIGSIIGLAIVTQMASAMRMPKLAILIPFEFVVGSMLLMTVICILASVLALMRLRKVEPGMVFR